MARKSSQRTGSSRKKSARKRPEKDSPVQKSARAARPPRKSAKDARLSDQVLELMQREDYVPQAARDLARALGLKGGTHQKLTRTIDEMLREGQIAKVKKDRYVLPRDADLMAGKILFRQSGSANLVPEDRTQTEEDRIPIKSEDTGVALHGDRVLIRLVPDNRRRPRYRMGKEGHAKIDDGNLTGRVIRVLERAREVLTGTLMRSRVAWYVAADDPRIVPDILVPDPKHAETAKRPKEGDKVAVRLVEWKHRHLNPQGEIVDVLGKTHTPGAEHQAILVQYGLDPSFPEPVQNEVEKLPDTVSKREMRGRLDLRKDFIFTIDPDDAKDFDDALSITALGDGRMEVGVHIADVSAYVKPGKPLDREGQNRGNSTYLVGQVIPMLPHKLSNGLCSLVEGEDRLTKSAFLTYSPKGQVLESRLANTVIRSRKRLTYKQAYAFLKENDLKIVRDLPVPPAHQTGSTGRALKEVPWGELKELQQKIRQLWDIAGRVRYRRMREGSLDLDMPEVKIFVDKDGYADRIERIENDESHQLIEEFMLAANEVVARTLRKSSLPAIYRVHDEPDDDKLQELREVMASFGVQIPDLTKRQNMTRLLEKLKDHPQGYTLRIHVLRSLKRACYRAEPDGHYGLAKADYTHFTSPIRRYSDLLVHRILDRHLVKIGEETAPKGKIPTYDRGKLDSLAEHVSQTEQNSTEAERESQKVKLLEFFDRETQKKDKTVFEAVIIDIKNHGMFVELMESMAFGLIHISTLRDDLYYVANDGMSIVGRRKKRTFNLGQKVRVVTERVDRFKRQIDFRIADERD